MEIDFIFLVIGLSRDNDIAFALAQAANSNGMRWFWSNGVLQNGRLNGFDARTIREAILELFPIGMQDETRLKLFGMFVDYAGSDRALPVCPNMHKSTLMKKVINKDLVKKQTKKKKQFSISNYIIFVKQTKDHQLISQQQ